MKMQFSLVLLVGILVQCASIPRQELPGHHPMWAPSSVIHGHVLLVPNGSDVQFTDIGTGKVEKVLKGGEARIDRALFSSDGSRVLSVSWREVRLWDVQTGSSILVFRSEIGVVGATLSRTGRYVAIFEAKGANPKWVPFVRLIDTTVETVMNMQGKRLFLPDIFPKNEELFPADDLLQFDPLDRHLLLNARSHFHIWDVQKPMDPPHSVTRERYSSGLGVFSPGGTRILFLAPANGAPCVLDLVSMQPLFCLDASSVSARLKSAVFSPDGARIVTLDEWSTIDVWDAYEGKRLGHNVDASSSEAQAEHISFAVDGRLVTQSHLTNEIQIFDSSTRNRQALLPAGPGFFTKVAVSPDGKKVALDTGKNTIEIHDWEAGKQIQTVSNIHCALSQIGFSVGGKKLMALCERRYYDKRLPSLRIWDLAKPNPAMEEYTWPLVPKGTEIHIFDLAPSGMVSGLFLREVGVGRQLFVFDPLSSNGLYKELVSAPGFMGQNCYSNDGKKWATFSRQAQGRYQVESMDVTTLEKMTFPFLHPQSKKTLFPGICGISGSGNFLAVPGRDEPILLNIRDKNVSKIVSLAFSPDELHPLAFVGPGEKHVAVLSRAPNLYNDAVHVLDVENGREKFKFEEQGKMPILGFVVFPDGRHLLTYTLGWVRIWDTQTGKPVRLIRSPAFSEKGGSVPEPLESNVAQPAPEITASERGPVPVLPKKVPKGKKPAKDRKASGKTATPKMRKSK